MRQAGQHGIADKAERVTYPQLFQEELSGPVFSGESGGVQQEV
jgi:hypothetical protein